MVVVVGPPLPVQLWIRGLVSECLDTIIGVLASQPMRMPKDLWKYANLPGWQSANRIDEPFIYKDSSARLPRCLNKCPASNSFNDIWISQLFLVIYSSLYIISNFFKCFHHLPCPIAALALFSHHSRFCRCRTPTEPWPTSGTKLIDLLSDTLEMSRYVQSSHIHLELVVLMTDRSGDARPAQDRVQSFIWDTTQQGDKFVPGKEGNGSRAERVERTIQAVDHQFANRSVAQHQGQAPQAPVGSGVTTAQSQGAHHSGRNADLNSVGQQFHGHNHRSER